MSDLFKYNRPPWTHARCGDNWDINLPHEADAKGVGVVATCFAGEDIARLISAAPELYEALEQLHREVLFFLKRDGKTVGVTGPGRALYDKVERALAKARGESGQ